MATCPTCRSNDVALAEGVTAAQLQAATIYVSQSSSRRINRRAPSNGGRISFTVRVALALTLSQTHATLALTRGSRGACLAMNKESAAPTAAGVLGKSRPGG